MKNITYLQRVLAQWTDPAMLATAYRDYFSRVYQRLLNNSAYIVGQEVGNEFDATAKVFYRKDDQILLFTLDQLRTAMSEYLNGNEDVTVNNISLTDIMDSISRDCDNTYLTISAFESLLKDQVSPGQYFSDTVNFRLDSLDVGVRDSISDLYSRVTSSGTLGDRLNSVLDFTSSTNFIEDSANDIPDEDTPLGQYTGQNPMIGWLGGIDIDWSNVVNVYGAIVKAQIKFMATVTKTLFNLVATPFKWLKSKFTKTFVNPVDFECSGDTCQFFDEGMTCKFNINELPNPAPGAIWNEVGDQGLTLQMAGSIYKVTRGSLQDEIIVNRVTKPLSFKAIYQCLQTFESKLGAWNGNTDSNFTGAATWSDLASIMTELSKADLDVLADENENVVYAGLYISRYLDEAYSSAYFWAFQYLTESLSGFNPTAEVNLSESVVSNTTGLADILSPFFQYISNVYFFSKAASGVSGRDHYLRLLSRDINLCHPDLTTNTITNADFMTILTFFGIDQANKDINLFSATTIINNGFAAASDIKANSRDGAGQKWPIWAIALKSSFENDPTLDGVWYGYQRGTDYSYDVNCHVKTDLENSQAVGKFLSTTVIVAAIAAAAIFGGKAVLNFKRSVTAARAATPSLYAAMNAAVASGDKTAINEAYQAIKRNNRIIRVGNTIFGGAAASSFNLKSLSDESATIISLIRG